LRGDAGTGFEFAVPLIRAVLPALDNKQFPPDLKKGYEKEDPQENFWCPHTHN
jgi:hypothetical protein